MIAFSWSEENDDDEATAFFCYVGYIADHDTQANQ